MPTSARTIVRQVLPPAMVNDIWSARYEKALPLSVNYFELSAILPAVFYMFRFRWRRGSGQFLNAFVSSSGSVPEQRRAATVERVAETLASDADFKGFGSDVEQAILGDLLLCFCVENSRRALGRDKQIQRVAPAHCMASWVDLPHAVAHLRSVPEMIVAMLADQKGEYVERQDAGKCSWFPVARDHEDNLLLRSFSQGIERPGSVDNLAADRFNEKDERIGIDQLVMVRLAQKLRNAPQKLRGKEGAKIPNQLPLSKTASRAFSEDIRTLRPLVHGGHPTACVCRLA